MRHIRGVASLARPTPLRQGRSGRLTESAKIAASRAVLAGRRRALAAKRRVERGGRHG